MNVTAYTTENSNEQFYPTPPALAAKMLSKIDVKKIETILEPSAGKGDLIYAAAQAYYPPYDHLDVDAVEIDPYLREICKYNFTTKVKEYNEKIWPMRGKNLTPEEQKQYDKLDKEIDTLKSIRLHIVHDDFLTYRTFKKYDLILMNPPFVNGDKHLLKALELQKDGGTVICLLNAETILNPYTKTRQLLKAKLAELDAKIEFVEDAFKADAERRAEVDVAIISVNIPEANLKSTLFDRMKKAVNEEHIPDAELKTLVSADFIEQQICMYNAEVKATLELIKEYKALAPYMRTSFENENYAKEPILSLVIKGESSHHKLDVNEYLKAVRLKYWKGLFNNQQFIGRLTTNLREEYYKNINKMAAYEFSAFNIKQVIVEMNAAMTKGVQDTIMDLFDKLTREHAYFPECKNTIHYYNGWKTNKAHKIGKKAIIPTNLFNYYYNESFNFAKAYSLLSDIEKALDYLDGGYYRGTPHNLWSFLNKAHKENQTRNIECTYFKVDFFKKGTVHIKFRPEAMPLVERLNIYAAQGKKWLPPDYGKKAYRDMTNEEKEVVDGLHSSGSAGSGELQYARVLQNKEYYLTSPASSANTLMKIA